jgi:hypothetical protein
LIQYTTRVHKRGRSLKKLKQNQCLADANANLGAPTSKAPGNSAFLKVSAAIADPFKGTERRRSAHCCAESPEKLPKSVRDVLGPAPSRSIASCGMKKPGPKCVPIQMQSDCDLHCGPPKTERECASVRRPSFIANHNRSNNVAGLDPALSRPR